MARPVNVGHATSRDMQLAKVANKHGAQWSLRIILECRARGVAISDGFAIVEQESGFENIFGCDHGPGAAFCHQPVTAARVKALLALGLGYQNGVGPMQLTAQEFVREAQADGGAHRTGVNIATGIRILGALQRDMGRSKGFGAYNGGPGNPNMSYAREVAARATKWHSRLT